MNDVVALESFSKPGLTSVRGVMHAAAPSPLCSRSTETALRLTRGNDARVSAGFARLRSDIERAWHAVMHLDCRETLIIADLIEHHTSRLSGNVAKALRCEIAALRAVAHVLQDDETSALPAALLACGPDAHPSSAQTGLTVCRSVYWHSGDLERFHAIGHLKPAGQAGRMRVVSELFDLAFDAAVALDQMRFGAARLLAAHALATARRHAGTHALPEAFAACLMAQAVYEQGQVDEAEALLAARMGGIRECGTVESALRAHGLLARIAMSRGQHGRARVLLNEAEALGERRGWPRLRAASLAQQVEIEVDSGRLAHAANALQRLAELVDDARAVSVNVRFEMMRYRTMATARLALAGSPCEVDIDALRQVHRDTVARGGRYAAVPVLLLMVEALAATGQDDDAVELLAGLLRLAPTAGLYRTLLDCNDRIAALIDDLVQRRAVPLTDVREQLGYASMLLMNRQREARGRTGEPVAARRPQAGAGLSERERLIVEMMGRGLSNKQIAVELRIAPETVKSHAKHLYTKLSVRNRTEAVTLATRLGLLQTPRSLCV